MINVEDIKIDNWINGCNGLPLKVDEDTFLNIKNLNCTCLSPIPITHELLIKFGFTQNITHNKYYHIMPKLRYNLKKGFLEMIVAPSGEGYVWFGKHLECKYVHQFQNIYSFLTGDKTPIQL